MKSSLINGKTKTEKYPCLKIYSNDMVVLFLDKGEGLVVHPGNSNDYNIGDYRVTWDEEEFELLTGTITLKN